jgi:hypothetical protein
LVDRGTILEDNRHMNKQLTLLNDTELDELQFSDEYADYIMNNVIVDRLICNGDTLLASKVYDTLLEAQEDGYLFVEFLETLGFTME